MSEPNSFCIYEDEYDPAIHRIVETYEDMSQCQVNCGEIFVDCACYQWNCDTQECELVLVGCPETGDPCIEAGNCCSYIGLLDDPNCAGATCSSSSSCTGCEDCVQACQKNAEEPSWDLDDCVAVNVDLSKLFYMDDGNLPESCPPTGSGVLYVPKMLTMTIQTSCFETITTQLKYLSGRWVRIWNPSDFQEEYDLNPDSDYLTIAPLSGETLLQSMRLNTFELIESDDWNTGWTAVTLEGNLRLQVRYRREYGDYVFVKALGTTFTRQICSGCDCSEVAARTPRPSGGPLSPNSDLYGSWGYSGYNTGSCSNLNDLINDVVVEVTGENTCRPPLPCVVGQCVNIVELSELDQTPGPCDKCHCDGGGRPLDIDVHCDGTVRPQSEKFPDIESFTLWFSPRGTSAVPVINNVIYDTTQLDAQNDIVKIHQASTPEELRSWVCLNLRFATVLDYEKLKTETANAVDSNWPYNDLYWNRSFVVGPGCSGYPFENDVPVNLVPC